MIGRTMQAAGMQVRPYHDYVPSFGGWGFWLGKHEDASGWQNIVMKDPDDYQLDLRHLDVRQINGNFDFPVNGLQTNNREISTILDMSLLHHYLGGWERYF